MITKARPQPATIGWLSRQTECPIETIRYYERTGLLPSPPRSAGGQRQYDVEAVRRLKFIMRSRVFGMPIKDIKTMLALIDGGDVTCQQVEEIAQRQLTAVRAQLAQLSAMEDRLARVVHKCGASKGVACHFVEELM